MEGKVEWRDIAGYEGLYQVCNLGYVRSLDRMVPHGNHFRRCKEHILRNCDDRKGYKVLILHKDGVTTNVKVHRLVLEAFVGSCPTGMVACHNDGDKSNNHVDNLRWDTYSNNNWDIVAQGRNWNKRKTQCPQGHPYNEENTIWIKGNGGRRCRICTQIKQREADQRFRAKKKQQRVAG